MLPESFPTNPLYFVEEELSRVEGTNCHAYVVRMLQQMATDWFQLSTIPRAYLASDEDRSIVGPKCKSDDDEDCYCQTLWRDLTLEDYKWALSNVYSRATDFDLSSVNGQDHVRHRVIAPIFDMMNHDFGSQVTHAMDEDGNLGVYNSSEESILPGTEIHLMYGRFPNEKFLLVYGFTIPDNPYDAVQITRP